MTLSVILVHYRDEERLLQLLPQLPLAFGQPVEVVIVDNGTDDPAFEQHVRERMPAARVLRNPTNLGFGAGVNQGVQAASGELLMILNPDVSIELGFFTALVACLLRHDRVGVVGPAVFRADGRRQLTAHRRFPNWLTVFVEYCLPLQVLLSRWLSGLHPHDASEAQHGQTHRTAHLTGVCLVTRRRVWDQVGEFDRRFFLYLEETDWQKRLAGAGYEAWYCADARCTHFGSIGKRFAQASPLYLTSLFRYAAKWWGPGVGLGVRLMLGLASLVSLASLAPAALVSLGSARLRRKVRVYFSGFGTILRWVLTAHPL